ncbi:hypothetical protein, partial [Corynebacterium phocae]|uniref:hypothetical protein n=1 Tax=Corynebacterium phocae TaxID=161895 RepID=UPI00123AA74D
MTVPEGTPLGEGSVQITDADGAEVGSPIDVKIVNNGGNPDDPSIDSGTNIDEITAGASDISGSGKPGDKLMVQFPGGKTVEVIVGDDGKWSVKVPEGTELKPGDKIVVTDGNGGEVSATVVGSTVPVINGVDAGATEISGSGKPGDKLMVQFPGGKTVEVIVGDDGKWSV